MLFIYVIGKDLETAKQKLQEIKKDFVWKDNFALGNKSKIMINSDDTEIKFEDGSRYVACAFNEGVGKARHCDIIFVDKDIISDELLMCIEPMIKSVLPKSMRIVYY
jgi:hypothetical protein